MACPNPFSKTCAEGNQVSNASLSIRCAILCRHASVTCPIRSFGTSRISSQFKKRVSTQFMRHD
eukprot:3280075-Amphidinium_carterae.1